MTPTETSAPHSMNKDQVLRSMSVTEEGLYEQEVIRRRDEYGINTLPQGRKAGPLIILLRQFQNPLIYILLISSFITFATGKYVDASVVLGVVLLNALIGFIQEYQAGKEIEALSQLVPEKVRVKRNQKAIEIESKELVPGDIVQFQSGDKVAADIRLLDTNGLRIEEAALTGESLPVEKRDVEVSLDASLGDRVNMAYSGTLVAAGQGTGVVTSIGQKTELGRIAGMLETTTDMETPLTKSMAHIGKVMSVAIFLVAILLFAISFYRGVSLTDALMVAITLAVAAIPEGLPAIITISLAIGVRRMAKRKAIIRKLPAVETLGATSVICTDKTGTLTKNEMTVQALWTPEATYTVTGVGYGRQGTYFRDGMEIQKVPDDLFELLKSGVLCNDTVINDKNGGRVVLGDPTEAALIVAFEKIEGNIESLHQSNARLASIPFESERQFMATLNATSKGNIIYIKGAPETILNFVRKDGSNPDVIRQMISTFANEGLRVLAFASKKHDGTDFSESDLDQAFELLGLVAMIDPPREEAIKAIRECHSAGISVKMITGDHKETAEAIAKMLKIANARGAISGTELEKLSDAELETVANDANVFARVAPEHKLRLVRSLQKQGNVTAMTGDGVNDAPALKQADIGVAMGITGTSVSKEAADLILLDDNFATIRTAVEEGRRIYDNLVKSLVFVLPTNLGLALIILTAVVMPQSQGSVLMPILPVQILWINLVASVALALPLAFEAKEPGLMARPPRPANEPIFTSFVLWRTIIVAVLMALGAIVLFLHELRTSSIREAQTMAVTTVIFFQIFYFLTCRSLHTSIWKIGLFSNPTAYFGIAVLLVLHFGFVYAPFMNRFLHSAPLPAAEWAQAIAVAALVLPVIAMEKIIRKKLLERVES